MPEIEDKRPMGYNPPMSERPNPWTIHLRPRSSMMQFRGAPWEPPPGAYGPPRVKPAEWFEQFKRIEARRGGDTAHRKTVALGTQDAGSRFQRSNRNPAVGFDTKRKLFTLIVKENGADKPFGAFRTESEGVEGFKALVDNQERGPHGIAGLLRTNKIQGASRQALMELNGPPAAQLKPAGHWQQNKGAPNMQSNNVNVGDWTTPQSQPKLHIRPMSASLLRAKERPAAPRRPSTALLRDKGQFVAGRRQDYLREAERRDLEAALHGERVEYNPGPRKMCWAGGWMEQHPPMDIPYDD